MEVISARTAESPTHKSWAWLPGGGQRPKEDRAGMRPSTGAAARWGSLGNWGAAVSEPKDGNRGPEGRVGGRRETGLAFFWVEAERVLKGREIPLIGRQRRGHKGTLVTMNGRGDDIKERLIKKFPRTLGGRFPLPASPQARGLGHSSDVCCEQKQTWARTEPWRGALGNGPSCWRVTQVGSGPCACQMQPLSSRVCVCWALSREASPGLTGKSPEHARPWPWPLQGHTPLPSVSGHSPVDCPGRVGEGHFAWPSSSELGLGRHVASWD